jgi:hypothetical protein
MTTNAKELPFDQVVTALRNWSQGIPDIRARDPEALAVRLLDHIATLTRERDESHRAHVSMDSALIDVLSGGLLQSHENVLDIAQYDIVGRVRDIMIEHEELIAEMKESRDESSLDGARLDWLEAQSSVMLTHWTHSQPCWVMEYPDGVQSSGSVRECIDAARTADAGAAA